MTYRGPWNAAGLRHRQTPRRYKPVAPIGEPQDFATPEMRARSRARYATSIYLETGHVSTCAHCGYHVCSCSDGPLTLDKAISRAKAGERQAEAHRASMQPQGGTAASTCNHSGIGLLGCEVCDQLAKVRQASERASGRSASSGVTEKAEDSDLASSKSMAYSQPSAETGINQTQGVMFEGRALKVGDQIVNKDTRDSLYALVLGVTAHTVTYQWFDALGPADDTPWTRPSREIDPADGWMRYRP